MPPHLHCRLLRQYHASVASRNTQHLRTIPGFTCATKQHSREVSSLGSACSTIFTLHWHVKLRAGRAFPCSTARCDLLRTDYSGAARRITSTRKALLARQNRQHPFTLHAPKSSRVQIPPSPTKAIYSASPADIPPVNASQTCRGHRLARTCATGRRSCRSGRSFALGRTPAPRNVCHAHDSNPGRWPSPCIAETGKIDGSLHHPTMPSRTTAPKFRKQLPTTHSRSTPTSSTKEHHDSRQFRYSRTGRCLEEPDPDHCKSTFPLSLNNLLVSAGSGKCVTRMSFWIRA